jgi:hypothetical protein
MSEVWRPVLGYEDRYEVSSLGSIRSKEIAVGARGGKTRIIKAKSKQLSTHHGYPVVGLCRDNKTRKVEVHVLVAEAFHGAKPFSKAQVRHLDGNSMNNYYQNLKWGTCQENHNDSVKHGTSKLRGRYAQC